MCQDFNRLCDPSAYPTVAASTVDEVVPESEGEIPADDLIVAAGQNQSMTSDGQSVTRRSISELIALDNHLASRRVSRNQNAWGSVSRTKGIPPSGNGLG